MAKKFSLRSTSTSILQQRKEEVMRGLQTPTILIRASYVRQYLTCGKPNCRCRRGFKHGPFHYLVQYLKTGAVRKFLLRTPAQRKHARASIAAYLEFQRQLLTLSEINTELLRRNVDGFASKPLRAV